MSTLCDSPAESRAESSATCSSTGVCGGPPAVRPTAARQLRTSLGSRASAVCGARGGGRHGVGTRGGRGVWATGDERLASAATDDGEGRRAGGVGPRAVCEVDGGSAGAWTRSVSIGGCLVRVRAGGMWSASAATAADGVAGGVSGVAAAAAAAAVDDVVGSTASLVQAAAAATVVPGTPGSGPASGSCVQVAGDGWLLASVGAVVVAAVRVHQRLWGSERHPLALAMTASEGATPTSVSWLRLWML